jgi:CHAT domain-containing protein
MSEAEEFVRLLSNHKETGDTEEKIRALKGAIDLEPRVPDAAIKLPREQMRGMLLFALGLTYQTERTVGERSDNIEEAIAAYEASLELLTQKTDTRTWAEAQKRLGEAYRDRTRGDPAEDLERTIDGFECALKVLIQHAFPDEWAALQHELGDAFLDRIKGDRAENMEHAIRAFENALIVFTPEAFPDAYATVQSNLASAYLHRIRGELAENFEKAIAACDKALTVFTPESHPMEWAQTMGNRGNAYSFRICGVRADNIEQAIADNEAALKIFPSGSTSWAKTEGNLAKCYSERIRGERAENIEWAIAACNTALSVFTHEAYPRDRTTVLSVLGGAYADRIEGSRSENIELAIAAYQDAATVWTRDKFSLEWARTQNNLAVVLSNRVLGDRAENLERAIEACQSALTVFVPDTFPDDWARTQLNLGSAYHDRIRGERVQNLELAIAAYEDALRVHTEYGNREAWAGLQNNVGNAYQARLRGDHVKNLELAISAYEAATRVFTRESFPEKWALLQNNLGVAHSNLRNKDFADNLEKAIIAYEAALTIRTQESLLAQWADTTNNLGVAFFHRIYGDRAENLERSISLLEAALTARTRERSPRDWAGSQQNLARAYANRIRGDSAENRAHAIAGFENALTVMTPDALPRDHVNVANLLGIVLLHMRDWQRALRLLRRARETLALLFGEGLDELEARDLIDTAGSLFGNAAYAACEIGDLAAAFEFACEGRARLLKIALRSLELELPPEAMERLAAARTAIHEAAARLERVAIRNRAEVLEELTLARRGLAQLLDEHAVAPGAPSVSALGMAQRLVPEGGAIVVPILTIVGCKALVLAQGDGFAVSVRQIPELTVDRFALFLRGPDRFLGIGGWLGAYSIQYLPDEERRQRIGEWREAIARLGRELWEIIGRAISEELTVRAIKPGARMIWLPTSAIGLLPLGLARDPANGERLGQTFEITYAPALDILLSAKERIQRPAAASLAAAINPTSDLTFTELEAQYVSAHFIGSDSVILERGRATAAAVLESLNGRSYWHFACHGEFDWADARRSALIMARQQPLTVNELLQPSGPRHPRLVVLSACETGLYEFAQNPDESTGLPSAFMALGAAGVVSTLWQVDDRATALIIARFYYLHRNQGLTPPAALKLAQAWLRDASRSELIAFAGTTGAAVGHQKPLHLLAKPQGELEHLGALLTWLGTTKQERPFAHPYYWGAFIYTGL